MQGNRLLLALWVTFLVVEALFTTISEDQLKPDQRPKVWLQK